MQKDTWVDDEAVPSEAEKRAAEAALSRAHRAQEMCISTDAVAIIEAIDRLTVEVRKLQSHGGKR